MLAHYINPERFPAPPELIQQNLLRVFNCSLMELFKMPHDLVQRHAAVWNAKQEALAAKRATNG